MSCSQRVGLFTNKKHWHYKSFLNHDENWKYTKQAAKIIESFKGTVDKIINLLFFVVVKLPHMSPPNSLNCF